MTQWPVGTWEDFGFQTKIQINHPQGWMSGPAVLLPYLQRKSEQTPRTNPSTDVTQRERYSMVVNARDTLGVLAEATTRSTTASSSGNKAEDSLAFARAYYDQLLLRY